MIGNELLNGKVQEANLLQLALTLRSLGVELQRVVMVRDDIGVIASELRALHAAHDVVFTSGGVGPTHDDVTIDAVAQAFDVPVVQDPLLEALLRGYYGERTTPSHLRMARVPAGARQLRAEHEGWPATVMDRAWILPGVPEAFRSKLPIVRHWLVGPSPFATRTVVTRVEEVELERLLVELVAAHSAVEVGSYPRWTKDEPCTVLTIDGRDHAAVELAYAALLAALPEGGVVRRD